MAQILLLEDDSAFAFALTTALERAGHDVRWCRTGSSARMAFEEERFDLLICDIFIYQDDRIVADGGLALIGWVRHSKVSPGYEWLEGFPIIAMSGAGDMPGNENILRFAKGVGADLCLAKPFEESELLEQIETLLSQDG